MYICDKGFFDSCNAIYDGEDFEENKMWNKMSSSWTTFLEIKVFSMKYTSDMLKINNILTNLLDVLFIAQGIMETHAKLIKELRIVDSFGDTYREMYNKARTIKSCLNDKIVLPHNYAPLGN